MKETIDRVFHVVVKVDARSAALTLGYLGRIDEWIQAGKELDISLREYQDKVTIEVFG